MNIKSISFGVLLGLYGSGAAFANPTGANVVHGSASISSSGNTLSITNSPNAIINWQDFSIASGETTQFIQQSAQSAVLNRVVGDNLSQINGNLNSNGRVFLINQAGIVFGENSVVDTAGLLASSLDITDQDFLDGNFHFEGAGAGAVVNRGVITAGPGGEIVLIAPQIENSGAITVEDGALILAAGESVTLSSWDLDGVEFEVQAPEHEVLNLGALVAEKGAVGLFAGSIRHEGVIEANSLSVDAAGNIVLSALSDVTVAETAVVDASGVAGGDITIQSQTGDAVVEGQVLAIGEETAGGSIKLLGNRVGLFGQAKVDASGQTGGGEVLVGGDYQGQGEVQTAQQTKVNENASVHADSLQSGDAGKVIVWADGHTEVHGSLSASAKGNSGNGGFIEASGKENLVMRGAVDATATNGDAGSILFDPKNIVVGGAGLDGLVGNILFTDNPSLDVTFTTLAMTTALLGGNVKLQANNDITFVGSLTSLGNGSDLSVEAGRSVIVNAGVMISLPGGNFNVLANAPSTGSPSVVAAEREAGPAEIRLLAGAHIVTNGGDVNLIVGDGAGRTGAQALAGNIILNGAQIETGSVATSGAVMLSGETLELAAGAKVDTVHDSGGTGGNITVHANDLNIVGGALLDSGLGADISGTMTIRTRAGSENRNIKVGYNTAQAGSLSIDESELATGIKTNIGALIIGDASHTGSIAFGGQLSSSEIGDVTVTTQGDVLFEQATGPGINQVGKAVNINAGRVLGSMASTAPDIMANNINLTTSMGIAQAGGGALTVGVNNLTFNNSVSGDVIILSTGSPTTVNSSSNVNGDIEISHVAPGNLTLDGVSINSGNGYVAAHTSMSGSNISIGTGGVSHNGMGHIELNAGGAGNGITQGSGAISAANGNISLHGSSFFLTGSNINTASGDVYIAPSQDNTALALSMGGSLDSFMLSGITAQNVILGTKHQANTGAKLTTASNINWGSAMGTLTTGYNLFLEAKPVGTITLDSPIILSAGNNLTFNAGDVVLNAGGTITGTATSDLVFNHNGVSGGIGIGTAGGMSISAAELGLIQGNFNHVAFHTQNAGNSINVGGTGVNFAHSTVINSMADVGVGASFDISGAGKSLSINAANTIQLGEGVSTAGGLITLNGAVSVQGDHTIASSGGNIVINGTVNGDVAGRNLTVNAGVGTIDYNGNIGQTTALDSLTSSGVGGINISATAITTAQNQSFNGTTNLLANTNLTSVAGGVAMNGLVTGPFGLTVSANTVASLSNISGINSLNATATTGSVNAGSISTTGAQNYTGKLFIGGDLSTASNAIVINDDAELSGSGTKTITTSGGDVTFVRNLNDDNGMPGNNSLTINAGSGSVAFGTEAAVNSIGQTSALNNLMVTAQNISVDKIGNAPSSAGVTGATTLTATNNINFNGPHVVANTQNYSAGGGYIAADALQVIAATGDITFTGGNVQSSLAGKQLEFISNGGKLDFTTANIVNDGVSNNATIIMNSNGGDIDINNIGQNGLSTAQLGNVFINSGAGTLTMHGDIDLGDHANAAVKISASTMVMNTNAEIETNKAVNDGKIFILTNDLQMSAVSGINSGDADIVIDTVTTANQITFGTGPGLSLSNAEMNNITSNGKIRIGLDTAAVADLGSGAVRTATIDFAETINQSGKNYVLNTTGAITSTGTQGLDLVANNLDIVGSSAVGTSPVNSLNTNVNAITGSAVGQANIADADSLVINDFELTGNTTNSYFSAVNNLTVDQIRLANASSLDLVSTAGSILDGNSGGGNRNNITATSGNLQNVNLTAGTGIANSTNVFELSNMSGALAANNTGATGDIYISNINTGGSAFQLSSIGNTAAGATTDIRNNVASEALNVTGVVDVTSSGTLVLTSQNGLITTTGAINAGSATINSGTANTALNANVTTASNLAITANSVLQSGGVINVAGLLGLNTATGIALNQAGNVFNQVQANNTATGSIDITSSGLLTVTGTGVHNQSSTATDHITLSSAGDMAINSSVVAQGGNVSLNSNNNNITITASGGNRTNVGTQGVTSSVAVNAGSANVLLQGGATANSDIRIDGGNSAGGSLSVIANDLILQAGAANSSGVKMSSHMTDIDLSGNLTLTAGTTAGNAEASIGGTSLLDIDLSGTGNISLNAGASTSHALLSSDAQIDLNTGGNVVLNGGAGNNTFAAITTTAASPVAINIGQGAAIGGDVILNGGTGVNSIATIGVQSFSSLVTDANIVIRVSGDVKAAANAGGVQIGGFEQAGSGRSAGGQITIEAGLNNSGGNIDLENAIVKTGTTGQVTLAAHDIVPGLHTVGQVKQGATGSILADQLYVQAFNAIGSNPVALNGAGNDVNKLAIRTLDIAGTAAQNGNIQYTDMNDFAVDGSGLGLSPGDTAIQSGGASFVTLNSTNGQVSQAADMASAVTAAHLTVNAANGITLQNTANDISSQLTAINSTAGNIDIFDNGGVQINGLKNTGRNIKLVSSGNINQGANTTQDNIEAANLHVVSLNSAGSFILLSNVGNDVDKLTLRAMDATNSMATNGAISFVDADGLEIADAGLGTSASAIQTIGNVSIAARDTITQGGLATDAITASGVTLLTDKVGGGAGISVNNTGNNIAGTLSVRTIDGGSKVAGVVNVHNSAATTLGQIETASAATIVSAGAVSQQGATTIDVDGLLNVTGAGGVALNNVGNALNAVNIINNSTGNINVQNTQAWTVDGTNTATSGTTIFQNTSGNMTLNSVNGGATAITLNAGMGSVIDGNGAAINIQGTTAALHANTGIGATDSLELDLSTSVDADNVGSGNIQLTHTKAATDLNFLSLDTNAGDIIVTATGNNSDVTIAANANSGNISVNTVSTGNDIAVGSIVTATGMVSLSASGAITDSNGASPNVVANTVALTSANGVDLDLFSAGVMNVTQATASASGNVDLSNDNAANPGGGLNLAGNVTAAAGNVTLTANGDITQSAGSLSGSALTAKSNNGQINIGNTAIASADLEAAAAINLTDAGTLLLNKANSTGAGAVNITTTGLMTVAGAGVNNTSGDVSLVAQGIDIGVNANVAAGNLVLNAQTGNANINDAIVTASGTATLTAANLSVAASANKSELQANGNVDITLTGGANLNAGVAVGADAILESTSGNLNITAATISMATSLSQDALLKAANGNAVLAHSGTCTSCNPTNLTAGADVGVIANNVLSIITTPGTANWTGLGDGVTWSDASNWFGNTVAAAGDINLDANMSVTPVEINVDSVVAANTLTGTKNLNVVTGGDLTIANNFSSTAGVKLTAGNLALNGSSNNLATLDVLGGALTTTGFVNVGTGLTLSGGQLGGSGTINAANMNWSGGSIALNTTAQAGVTVTGAATKTLSAVLSGNGNSNLSGAGVLDLVSGGRFIHSSANTFTIQDGSLISSDSTGFFINNGRIEKTTAGSGVISVNLNNVAGSTVDLTAGTLAIHGTAAPSDVADYTVAAGGSLQFMSDRTLAGSVSQAAASTLSVANGVNLTLQGVGSNYNGNIDLQAGSTLILGSAHTFNGAVSGLGTGSITANADTNFNQGLNIGGALQITSAQTVTAAVTSNVGSLGLEGVLIAGGDVNVAGLASLNGGSVTGTGSAVNAANVDLLATTTIAKDLRVSNLMNWSTGDLNLSSNTLHIESGATLNANSASSVLQGALQNQGQVNIAGILDVANGYTQAAGTTQLNAGTLKAVTATIQGGNLSGNGSVDGNLLMTGGTLSPGNSAGTINISGNLDLAAGSKLELELGGTAAGQSDQLNVSGNVSIAAGAELGVALINGFTLSNSDSFTPLTYAGVSGSFSTQDLPAGIVASLEPSSLSLQTAIAAAANPTPAVDTEELPSIDEEIANLLDEQEEDIAVIDEELTETEAEAEEDDKDDDEDSEGNSEDEEEATSGSSGTLVCS